MNKKININLIAYKAKRFGFNPALIEYLLNVQLDIDDNMKEKFSHLLKNIYKIEKSVQISISK
jgi:hypothetical protein